MEKQAKYRLLSRVMLGIYLGTAGVCCVYYGLKWDAYHFSIGLLSVVIPPLWVLLFRILKLKRTGPVDFMALLFLYLAYPLGSVVDLYAAIYGFDKFVHTLSGVFVSTLCLALFLALKPDHEIRRKECALAAAFVFFGFMAVAGLWEICEYGVHALTGRDVQHVLDTGVSDTMQDMIVCMIGTLFYVGCVIRRYRGKPNALTDAAESFVEANRPFLHNLFIRG